MSVDEQLGLGEPAEWPFQGRRGNPEDWRLEQALGLGIPFEEAVRFAESRGELERLRQLVAAGCDWRVALGIVI